MIGEPDYRGWRISPPTRPPTRHAIWSASRMGVGMCHPTRAGLEQMIDRRIIEAQARIKWCEDGNSWWDMGFLTKLYG